MMHYETMATKKIWNNVFKHIDEQKKAKENHIDSLDEILQNLRKDKNYYNHGQKEDIFGRFDGDE